MERILENYNLKEHNNTGINTKKLMMFFVFCCIAYSGFIQHKVANIPYALLSFGILAVVIFLFDLYTTNIKITDIITIEGVIWLVFNVLILITGFFFSPNVNNHVQQWKDTFEYYTLMIIIIYVMRNTKSIDFILKSEFIVAFISCIVFLIKPVAYQNNTTSNVRYSLSSNFNPNGFAMNLVMGIWVVLYYVSLGKLNLVLGIGWYRVMFNESLCNNANWLQKRTNFRNNMFITMDYILLFSIAI